MIHALADDFSGAAEVGGVAARYGLTATILTDPSHHSDTDLVVIDTDTRSLGPWPAAAVVEEVLRRRAPALRTGWLFKKVDSVLRGPVVAEIAAILHGRRFARALLVPANPDLGRVIRGGRYLIDGRPITETEFAGIPDSPIRSDGVRELLGSFARVPIHIRAPGAALPDDGVVVGEAERAEELAEWAAVLDARTLAAGAAAFFAAVLARRTGRAPNTARFARPEVPHEPTLVVSGSASVAARELASVCERRGLPVLRLPVQSVGRASDAQVAHWAELAARGIERHGWVLLTLALAAEARVPHDAVQAAHNLLVRSAGALLDRTPIQTLYVEGGATASALAQLLGWTRFDVIAERAPGTVVVRPDAPNAPNLLVKPGSYRWPAGTPTW